MILKKLGKKVDRYQDISEIPIHNWFKCFDFKFECVRVGNFYGGIGNEEDLDAFDKLTVQYEEKYGKSEAAQERDRKRKQLAKHRENYHKTGDEFLLNTIRPLEEDLKIKGGISFELFDEVVSLKRILKIEIDPKKVTVTEYESMKKQAKEAVKQL